MEPESPSRFPIKPTSEPRRILVVDDEPMIARGIRSMLGRLDLPSVGHIDVVFSGADAIERIAADAPDIVILDIRMPGLTGLDVLGRFFGTSGAPLFFVLSGHDEFDYVKQAFKLGALDYLLKPASIDDLSTLMETATRPRPGPLKEALADDVTARWSIQMAIERALDLGEESTFDDVMRSSGLDVKSGWFRVSIVRTPRMVPDGALAIRKAIGPRIWEMSQQSNVRAYFFWTPDSDLGLLWNVTDRNSIDAMRTLWSTFPHTARNAAGSIAAVSSAASGGESIAPLYARTSSLLLYRFHPDAPRFLAASDVREEFGVPPVIDLSDVVRAAAGGDLESILVAAEEVFARSPRTHGGALENAYRTLSDAVGAYCSRVGVEAPPVRPMAELDTVDRVRDELRAGVSAARTALRNPLRSGSTMDFVIEYIESHLHEDLDMAQVASAAGLSYSHFSRAFKERTGEGFGHHLLGRRMERARRLLDRPTVRVSEVAYAVGYQNHKHFTRAFRSYFGRTPSEYRDGK